MPTNVILITCAAVQNRKQLLKIEKCFQIFHSVFFHLFTITLSSISESGLNQMHSTYSKNKTAYRDESLPDAYWHYSFWVYFKGLNNE